MTRLAPLALLLLASCAGPRVTHYAGPVTTGSPGPTCISARGSLEINGQDVLFAPNQGTWVLLGNLKPGNLIQAEKSTIGVDKKLFDTNFEAHLLPDGTIQGTYTTPRCTYQVALTPI